MTQNGPVSARLCVVGNSGSGKTHLARRLAARLAVPHIELDAINHRAGWVEAPPDEFRAEVGRLLDQHAAGWVVDGNYRNRVGDLLDPDTYVWLDYPRGVVLSRVLRRTLGRLLLRRELWNGNRESWSSLLKSDPRENIVLWSWTQHHQYRRMFEEQSAARGSARWVRLRTPRDTERWLSTITGPADAG